MTTATRVLAKQRLMQELLDNFYTFMFDNHIWVNPDLSHPLQSTLLRYEQDLLYYENIARYNVNRLLSNDIPLSDDTYFATRTGIYYLSYSSDEEDSDSD